MAIDALERGDLPFPRSLPEFQHLFPDDVACAAYLERARWINVFVCSRCGTFGEGRPYAFISVEKLLEDFFAEVEKLCETQGISTEVVDDKET